MGSSGRILAIAKNYISLEKARQKYNTDKRVLELIDKASSFLLSHSWCTAIVNGWLGREWGHILGIFLFEITPVDSEVDDVVWVVVGDVPPAYIDIESAVNIEQVVAAYIDIMMDWVECVEAGSSVEEVYPVAVPPTLEYANMLRTRLELISNRILPELRTE